MFELMISAFSVEKFELEIMFISMLSVYSAVETAELS